MLEGKNATYCEINARQIIEGKLSWVLSETMELGGQKEQSKAGHQHWVGLGGVVASRVGLMAGGSVSMAGGRQEGMCVGQGPAS